MDSVDAQFQSNQVDSRMRHNFRQDSDQKISTSELDRLIKERNELKRKKKRVKQDFLELKTYNVCPEMEDERQFRTNQHVASLGKEETEKNIEEYMLGFKIRTGECRQFKKRIKYSVRSPFFPQPKQHEPNFFKKTGSLPGKPNLIGKRSHFQEPISQTLDERSKISRPKQFCRECASPGLCVSTARCSPRSCVLSSRKEDHTRTLESIEITDIEKEFKVDHSKKFTETCIFSERPQKNIFGSVETHIDASIAREPRFTFNLSEQNISLFSIELERCFLNRKVYGGTRSNDSSFKPDCKSTRFGSEKEMLKEERVGRSEKIGKFHRHIVAANFEIKHCQNYFLPFSYNVLANHKIKKNLHGMRSFANLRVLLNDIFLFGKKRDFFSYQLTKAEQRVFAIILKRQGYESFIRGIKILKDKKQKCDLHTKLGRRHSNTSDGVYCFRLIFSLLEYEIKLKIVRLCPMAAKKSEQDLDIMFCLYYFHNQLGSSDFETILRRYLACGSFRASAIQKMLPYLTLIRPFFNNSILLKANDFPSLNPKFFNKLKDSPTLLGHIQSIVLNTLISVAGGRVKESHIQLRSYAQVKNSDLGQKMLFWIVRRNNEQLDQLFSSWNKKFLKRSDIRQRGVSPSYIKCQISQLRILQRNIGSKSFHLPWTPIEIRNAFAHCYIMINSILLKENTSKGMKYFFKSETYLLNHEKSTIFLIISTK